MYLDKKIRVDLLRYIFKRVSTYILMEQHYGTNIQTNYKFHFYRRHLQPIHTTNYKL